MFKLTPSTEVQRRVLDGEISDGGMVQKKDGGGLKVCFNSVSFVATHVTNRSFKISISFNYEDEKVFTFEDNVVLHDGDKVTITGLEGTAGLIY